MDKKIMAHFERVDSILFAALQQITDQKDLIPRKSSDYFSDICETIVNQQLSSKAGATIYYRFIELFPKKRITPDYLFKLNDEAIRSIGTSWNKVKFLKSLATSVVNKDIDLKSFDESSDEDVIKELVKLHGIGPWTAEMFLMFSLGRPDVFSYGDLGLKNAIQKLYKFKKEPSRKQMEKIVKKWSPYRTYACRILWRSLDTGKVVE